MWEKNHKILSEGKVKVKLLSHVRHFVTPWTVAYQASPSMGFSRQEYWRRLPFPSPVDLPDLGIKHGSPALAGRFFTTSTNWQAQNCFLAAVGSEPVSLLPKETGVLIQCLRLL